jgi:hypothetical protein
MCTAFHAGRLSRGLARHAAAPPLSRRHWHCQCIIMGRSISCCQGLFVLLSAASAILAGIALIKGLSHVSSSTELEFYTSGRNDYGAYCTVSVSTARAAVCAVPLPVHASEVCNDSASWHHGGVTAPGRPGVTFSNGQRRATSSPTHRSAHTAPGDLMLSMQAYTVVHPAYTVPVTIGGQA